MPSSDTTTTPGESWRRVKFSLLARLILAVREPLRWRWYHNKKHAKGPRLQLITPRGVVWDFKLSGGAWIKKTSLTLSDLEDKKK